jgi:aspartyl protease family protein
MCSFGNYYSKNIETITRHFLSWALIFIDLISAYGFKDVLTAALFPQISHQSGETFVYSKAGDGHFYLQLVVNGGKVKFLLDTGATNLVLNKKTAEKVGFDPNELSYNF